MRVRCTAMVKPYGPARLTLAHVAVYTNPRERAIRGDRRQSVVRRSCCRGGQEQRIEADGGHAPGRGHQHHHQLPGHPRRAFDGGGLAGTGCHRRTRRGDRSDHVTRRAEVRRGFRRGPPVPRLGLCAGSSGRSVQAGQGRTTRRRRHRFATTGHASGRAATARSQLQHRARLCGRGGRSLARRGDSAGVPVGGCDGEHPDGRRARRGRHHDPQRRA